MAGLKGILESIFHRIMTHVKYNRAKHELNGLSFVENVFKCIFLNEDVYITIRVWTKFFSEIISVRITHE